MRSALLRTVGLGLLLALLPLSLWAAAAGADGVMTVSIGSGSSGGGEVAGPLKVMLGLTLLSLAPAMLVSVTSFIRTIIVLSMLRHAFGMQETPPNTVLVSLALFLTLFSMTPILDQVYKEAYQPYVDGQLDTKQALTKGLAPLRQFMIRQTREQDLALMVEISRSPRPNTVEDIGTLQLIPAFMLSELRAAFQIGFVVFLPFLLIDLVVSSILMSLGMMMVPPATIALPVKLLMFVLIDGWNLVVKAILGSIVH